MVCWRAARKFVLVESRPQLSKKVSLLTRSCISVGLLAQLRKHILAEHPSRGNDVLTTIKKHKYTNSGKSEGASASVIVAGRKNPHSAPNIRALYSRGILVREVSI